MRSGLDGPNHAGVRSWWRGAVEPIELVPAWLLTLQLGIWWLALLIASHSNDGIDEAEEWRLFVFGWTLVPPLSVGGYLALRTFAVRRSLSWPASQIGLVVLDALVLFATALALRALAPGWALESFGAPASTAPAYDPAFPWVYGAFLAGFPIANLAMLLLAGRCIPQRVSAALGRALDSDSARAALAVALPVSMAATIALLCLPRLPGLGLLLLASVAAIPRLSPFRLAPSKAVRWGSDVLVVSLLAWLCLDPHLHFELRHHLWFLGPVHALMEGETLMVDVVSAYGVLPIQLLAAFFRWSGLPLSPAGLALVVDLLLLAFYVVVYALLRTQLRSLLLAVVAMAAIVATNFFGVYGGYSLFPSAGPLRFLPPLALPALAALRTARPRWGAATRLAEAAALCVCLLWSVESFGFALAAWLGIVCVEGAFAIRDGLGLRSTLRRVALVVVALLATLGLYALGVWSTSGQWPHWGRYLDYLRSFSPAGRGFSLLGAPMGGAWVAVVVAYLGSLIGCLYALPGAGGREGATRLAVVAALTTLGISQLSYWLALSIEPRLATVGLPALMVVALWADRMAETSSLPRASRATTGALVLSAAVLVVGLYVPNVGVWAQHAPLPLGAGSVVGRCDRFPRCLVAPEPVLRETRVALELLRLHAPDQRVAGLFLAQDVTAEVMIRSGLPHAFPISHAGQDATSERNAAWITEQPHELRAGDVILVDREQLRVGDALGANRLLRQLFARLCNRDFDCILVDRRGSTSVLRLEARG